MIKVNKSFIYFICLISAMGGLLFGYDWVVIGGAKPFYELYFNISDKPNMQGWAMSIALLGCLIGSMLCGFLANNYGRKKLLIISAFLFTISAYYTGSASTFTIFLIARLIGGIGIGLASNLSPIYIAEISPTSMRGKLVSLNQLTIVIGILGAQITNLLIAETIPTKYTPFDVLNSWNGQMGWRYMFWAELIPAILFLFLIFLIPESPRWLCMKKQNVKAFKTLTNIGGKAYATKELEGIKNTNNQKNLSLLENIKCLFSKKMQSIIIIGIIIAIFQQWCGTNVIFNYAQEIFQSAGFNLNDVLFNIVVTGIANLLFTFIAIYTVDKIGRRTLMLIGASSLALIYLILGVCYFFHLSGWFMVTLVVLAIGSYAMSLGPVTWVLLSEIFPNSIRALAMALSTFSLWIGCFTLTYSFPFLNTILGSSGTFWIYAIICTLGFLFIYKNIKETKNQSLENIEQNNINSSKK